MPFFAPFKPFFSLYHIQINNAIDYFKRYKNKFIYMISIIYDLKTYRRDITVFPSRIVSIRNKYESTKIKTQYGFMLKDLDKLFIENPGFVCKSKSLTI
jgi:hypothetical protein